MRTKQLKHDGQTIEAILVCGGPGFKVYFGSDSIGWLISIGRKVFNVSVDSRNFITVNRYINLKYQRPDLLEGIKKDFDAFLESLTNSENRKGA